MTISPSVDPIVKISIELLPEFGFTVQDEPVYGPGSVFQGKKKKKNLVLNLFLLITSQKQVSFTFG